MCMFMSITHITCYSHSVGMYMTLVRPGFHNKISELGVLKSRHLFSHTPGHWKPRIGVLAWPGSGKDTL